MGLVGKSVAYVQGTHITSAHCQLQASSQPAYLSWAPQLHSSGDGHANSCPHPIFTIIRWPCAWPAAFLDLFPQKCPIDRSMALPLKTRKDGVLIVFFAQFHWLAAFQTQPVLLQQAWWCAVGGNCKVTGNERCRGSFLDCPPFVQP